MSYSVRLSRTKKKVSKNVSFKETNDLIYDSTSDDDSIKEYLSQKHKINHNLISKLPNHKIEVKIKKKRKKKSSEKKSSKEKSSEKKLSKKKLSKEKLSKEKSSEKKSGDTYKNDMIDRNNLKQDCVGGKIVYYDYDKHIIYNGTFSVIGTITEEGEIELIEAYERIYKKLLFNNPVQTLNNIETSEDLEDNDNIDTDHDY